MVWEDRIFLLAAVAVQGAAAASADTSVVTTAAETQGSDGGVGGAPFEAPHEGKQGNNSWASSSAITDGEHVFAFFGSHGLYAYDMDGAAVWDVDLGDMRIRNGFGEGATPVLHGDKLVVVWDHQGESFIAALDKSSGEEVWRQPRNEPDTWATPLVVELDDRTQVITPGERRTYGYDLDNGELIWEGPGLTVNPIPSPVYADGVVYLTSVAVHYGPQRLEGLQEVYSSPVGAAGRVYLVGRDGEALVLSNGSAYEVLARNSLDDGFEASPAIVGDELCLRGRRFLYRIEEGGRPD